MTEEGLSMVPHDERPSLDDLEGYTESRYPPDTDYSAYRRELMLWLSDHRRDQEQKREEGKNRHTLPGHGPDFGGDDDGSEPFFDLLQVKRTIKSRPLH